MYEYAQSINMDTKLPGIFYHQVGVWGVLEKFSHFVHNVSVPL